jgi:hypothetical protein
LFGLSLASRAAISVLPRLRRLRQGKDDALWASNLGGGAKATMLGAKARLLADPA